MDTALGVLELLDRAREIADVIQRVWDAKDDAAAALLEFSG